MLPTIAAFLLVTKLGYRPMFWIALIPGLLSVAAFMFLVKETANKPAPHMKFFPTLNLLPKKFKLYLLGVGVFGTGDFSHTLLILMAVQILKPVYGPLVANSAAIMLYVVHNTFYAGLSFPIGYLSDKFDKKKLLGLGYLLSAVMCTGFIFVIPKAWYLAILFILAGTFIAAEDVLEGSITAELLPNDLKGTGYGTLATVNGIGDFVSSFIVGLLWTQVSPAAGFLYAGIMSLCGAGIILRLK